MKLRHDDVLRISRLIYSLGGARIMSIIRDTPAVHLALFRYTLISS